MLGLRFTPICLSVQDWDIMLYGDSQLESLKGVEFGQQRERANGVPEVWNQHFGHVNSANMAMAGGRHCRALCSIYRLCFCMVEVHMRYHYPVEVCQFCIQHAGCLSTHPHWFYK